MTPAGGGDASTAVAEEAPGDEAAVRDDDNVEELETAQQLPDWAPEDSRKPEIVDQEQSTAADPVDDVRTEQDAERLAELTCELIERDELISALTEQLEDAAERLDRLHREGFDRGPSGSTSNPGFTLPPGGTEMKEQIGQLVGAWEELDAVTWMQEFDRKLDELTSLVSRRNSADPKPAPDSSHPMADSWMGRLDDVSSSPDEAPASRLAGWEEMKAQLMNEGDPEEMDEPSVDIEDVPPVSEAPPAWDLEAPHPIDFEDADRDALIVAVEERDEFISHLIRRLRSAPCGPPDRVDWDALNNAPEELRERLQQLEARLEEVLRMEECDLSLERARLARERARLEQMGRKVERVRTGAEYEDVEDGSDVSQNERRWLRVFGFGRKADDMDEVDED